MLLHLVTSHENKNVRRVVIQHMTNLIKANRDLFHCLVVNEELASMHFLTVVHDSSSGKIWKKNLTGTGSSSCFYLSLLIFYDL